MPEIIEIDDQPMAAQFFGVGQWLTDFITPNSLEVQALYKDITQGTNNQEDRIAACWEWVAKNVRYVKLVKGKLEIHGQISLQNDFWVQPAITIRTRVGNCAVKSFLLTSLLRNEVGPENVYCVLGNLYNGDVGGHAWVQVQLPSGTYIMESTRSDIPAFIPIEVADRYEPIHYFNDKEVWMVEGRSTLQPITGSYSLWLKDYLDWVYIHGEK
jgi:hypothetical protein